MMAQRDAQIAKQKMERDGHVDVRPSNKSNFFDCLAWNRLFPRLGPYESFGESAKTPLTLSNMNRYGFRREDCPDTREK